MRKPTIRKFVCAAAFVSAASLPIAIGNIGTVFAAKPVKDSTTNLNTGQTASHTDKIKSSNEQIRKDTDQCDHGCDAAVCGCGRGQ